MAVTYPQVYDDIKDAICTAGVALNLTSLTDPPFAVGGNWFNQWTEDASNILYPAVIVTGAGETEEDAGGDSETKFLWLPVFVYVADTESHREQARGPEYMRFRHQIYTAFNWQRLSVQLTAGPVYPMFCKAEYRVMVLKDVPWFQHVQTGLVLKFFFEEQR